MNFSEGPLALLPDPIASFRGWYEEAEKANLHEPNSMTLATSTPDGKPRARIVLMKGIGPRGIEFFTNYESRKGRDLLANPFAAAVFHWKEQRRQARFEGAVEVLTSGESDAYFKSRARGSQIGAWASPQSQPISDRDELVARTKQTEERFIGVDIPRPPHWGGFRLLPARIEFWEERPFRLHERVVYEWIQGAWVTSRLAP